jgi:hypothetical protein
MSRVTDILAESETEVRIQFFHSHIYPLLNGQGLMNEKELSLPRFAELLRQDCG